MKYKERKELIEKIKQDIEDISIYQDVDHFIDANFAQGLGGHNEYWDNSIELSYTYKMLDKIRNDKEFFPKLEFIIEKYFLLTKILNYTKNKIIIKIAYDLIKSLDININKLTHKQRNNYKKWNRFIDFGYVE